MLEQKLTTIYEASTELDQHKKEKRKERAKKEELKSFIYLEILLNIESRP